MTSQEPITIMIFDEFTETEGSYYTQETGTPFANTLLRMLDGQECRLDSKYGKVFTKKRNVPIVMIANQIPRC